MNELKVYWRPGCSSCVRVKEFLAGLNIPFESVNVSSRPEAMEELRALGVRTVPVVARGREFVFAQELADVSRFLGRKVDFARLPAPVLMEKWLHVLRAAQGINGKQDDDSAQEAGAVYFFTRSGTSWAQKAYVKSSNDEAFDEFGSSVALSRDGRTLAVGARGEDSGAKGIDGNQADNSMKEAGAVYVFTYNPSSSS